MWKILTAQIREEMYYSQIRGIQFPEEKKSCNERTRETGHFLYIDQHNLKESIAESAGKVVYADCIPTEG